MFRFCNGRGLFWFTNRKWLPLWIILAGWEYLKNTKQTTFWTCAPPSGTLNINSFDLLFGHAIDSKKILWGNLFFHIWTYLCIKQNRFTNGVETKKYARLQRKKYIVSKHNARCTWLLINGRCNRVMSYLRKLDKMLVLTP